MIYILGGGTVSHVRSHLALSAPAYGQTARRLRDILLYEHNMGPEHVRLYLTRMADPTGEVGGFNYANPAMETNEDVARQVSRIVGTPGRHVVFHNVAHVDFDGSVESDAQTVPSGKHARRLQSRRPGPCYAVDLRPARKVVAEYRRHRKDIYAVAFKTTAGASSDEQYRAALLMLKEHSLNLVLANDVMTRNCMIVAPEETRYCETTDREVVLRELVRMALARSTNTFTRSTVVPGELVSFASSPFVPANLRAVVDYLVKSGAYKGVGPMGNTSGHFAVRVGPGECLTSRRKTNYNAPGGLDLVRVQYDGLGKVTAVGAKPSVGGQSQRIVFEQHPDEDCIVHFHCPLKARPGPVFPMGEQWMNECGSHQCGAQTADRLGPVAPGIKAVMLDNHGPNIVFGRDVPAQEVIDFIEDNFDLAAKTGGLVAA